MLFFSLVFFLPISCSSIFFVCLSVSLSLRLLVLTLLFLSLSFSPKSSAAIMLWCILPLLSLVSRLPFRFHSRQKRGKRREVAEEKGIEGLEWPKGREESSRSGENPAKRGGAQRAIKLLSLPLSIPIFISLFLFFSLPLALGHTLLLCREPTEHSMRTGRLFLYSSWLPFSLSRCFFLLSLTLFCHTVGSGTPAVFFIYLIPSP